MSSREIARWISEQFNISISHTTICSKLKKVNLLPGVILVSKNTQDPVVDFNYGEEMKKVLNEAKLVVDKQFEKLQEAHQNNDINQMIIASDTLKKSLKFFKRISDRCKVFQRKF